MATTRTASNPVRQSNASVPAMPEEKRLVDGDATWYSGQLLYGSSDGLVYTCAGSAVVIHYLALQDLASAIGNDTTYKPMARLHADDVLLMNVWHATAASALAPESITGLRYELEVDSNVCYVDLEEYTTDAFQVIMPYWRVSEFDDASTDLYGRVLVNVIASVVNAEGA